MKHRLLLRATALGSLVLLSSLAATPAAAQSEPFIGQIMCAGFNFAPRGWALLNGQLLPIAQNTALFSLLGTNFGGDGRTTFALPDMRGRFITHMGAGPGLTARTIGETGGAEATNLTLAQLPPHTHTLAPRASNNDANSMSPAGMVPAAKARTTLYAAPGNTVSMAPSTTSSAGSGQPVPMMPPFLTVNCFIATQGIFPARD